MTEQSQIISKYLDAIEADLNGLSDPQTAMMHMGSSIGAVLDGLEKMDASGAFEDEIAAGRQALANMDVPAGFQAVADARAKLK